MSSDDCGYTASLRQNQPDFSALFYIWAMQLDAVYFCIVTAVKNSKDDKASGFEHHWFTREQFGNVQSLVDRYIATRNVYACPRGLKHPSRAAGSEANTTLAYADLDGSDPRELPPKLRPHIAIQSSPGSFVGVWVCDGIVPEALNQRLTYAIGADKGGWLANKLLRLIPGTINHKYPDKPRVELLWDERRRPPLKVAVLEALPPVNELKPTREPRGTLPGRADRVWSNRAVPATSASGLRKRRPPPPGNLRKHPLDARDRFLRSYGLMDGERRAMIDGAPSAQVDGSGLMYRVAITMREHGASRDLVAGVLMPSPLNAKFVERGTAVEHMSTMLDKIDARLEARR